MPAADFDFLADPVNRRILAVSEDRVAGFEPEPFACIARQCGLAEETVLERIGAMLRAGVIRRVRQTLMTTDLVDGGLVAWRLPSGPDPEREAARLHAAFDWLLHSDPFTGHLVIRNTAPGTAGAGYRLWTTLKVPAGVSPEAHCERLAGRIGGADYQLMPALGIFALGVGHIRRMGLAPGARQPQRAAMRRPRLTPLTEHEWRIVFALKRELAPEEIAPNPWARRAREAGVTVEEFCRVAQSLAGRGLLGRFSTFLEHAKPVGGTGAAHANPSSNPGLNPGSSPGDGRRVAYSNGLIHWAVPPDRIEEAGGEIGRHTILTHCYWRDGGPAFGGANIMGVIHGEQRDRVLEHKAAIDAHLAACGIPIGHSAVFWGERSEVKPSEISPVVYREWVEKMA